MRMEDPRAPFSFYSPDVLILGDISKKLANRLIKNLINQGYTDISSLQTDKSRVLYENPGVLLYKPDGVLMVFKDRDGWNLSKYHEHEIRCFLQSHGIDPKLLPE